MNVEKLADIISGGRELAPADLGFTRINGNHYAKNPFELKSIARNKWTLLKWTTEDGKLLPIVLLKGISLNTEGLMKLQKHLRNYKLDELLGTIS